MSSDGIDDNIVNRILNDIVNRFEIIQIRLTSILKHNACTPSMRLSMLEDVEVCVKDLKHFSMHFYMGNEDLLSYEDTIDCIMEDIFSYSEKNLIHSSNQSGLDYRDDWLLKVSKWNKFLIAQRKALKEELNKYWRKK